MNTPVNFEIAKLLKEKGFNSLNCKQGYHGEFGSLENDSYPFLGTYYFLDDCLIKNNCEWKIQAPTIAEAVMWLYEKHGIWLTVCIIGADGFGYWLHDKNRKRLNPENQGGYWYSPTEAYEAAIEYTLKNLLP